MLLVEIPGSQIVSTTLWYRAGSRDERRGLGGAAHFLEHMMFKGSPGYGPGQIDRRTQALGGSNNAYTSHDATVYYFKFAARVWREALAIEADRMAALTLDPREVDSERQVILEEVAMYESDPWDALEQAVATALFDEHPYGRAVLGTREELLATGPDELAAFHRAFYRPDNAALVVAGAVSEDDLAAVESTLGALPRGHEARPPMPPWQPPSELRRIERRHGEVPRMLLALPAPPSGHPDHALLRVLVGALADGRTSRLRHELVEERERCLFVDADAAAAVGPGTVTVEAELHEGVDPSEVEERVLAQLRALGEEPLGEAELARARVALLADWVFGNEQAHQQALTLGYGLALYDEAHAERSLAASLAATPEELQEAARRWLVPDRGVIGWALPAKRRRRG
ncbi:MAG TPA: pitrilysin family protein [Thermoanaerobaculia bacterium]|nr:pitrilysin family protein [Thermoanaerobaculia bacterium]